MGYSNEITMTCNQWRADRGGGRGGPPPPGARLEGAPDFKSILQSISRVLPVSAIYSEIVEHVNLNLSESSLASSSSLIPHYITPDQG